MPGPGMSSLEALDRSFACAAARSVVDYGLHGVVTAATGSDLSAQFAALTDKGVASVKVFLTYEGFAVDDDRLLAVMDEARARGMIVMIHAENDAAIRRTTRRLIELGRTALRYHAVAHAAAMEREAVHRAATFAELTGARIAIVHVSSAGGCEEILRSRRRGAAIVAETCPQYLFLTASMLDRPAGDAARFVFAPPPRSPSDQRRLWQALATGDIDLWSSDHSPFRLADKIGGEHGGEFHRAVSGIPGLETRLPLLFSEGLVEGRLPLDRYLALTARNAAEIYGIPRKGAIAEGFDADLALWDPHATWTIDHAALHSRVDFTPFDGKVLRGRPVVVMVRGRTVVADGETIAEPGTGIYVPRAAALPASFGTPVEDTTPWHDT